MIDREFGKLEIGQRKTSAGRTITETDVVHFCMLTGNWLGLHADAEYAKGTRFGQRVVQGSLVFSIANALLPTEPGVIEAFYGVDTLRFHKPTFIGDTLRSTVEILELRPRQDECGLVKLKLEAHNQRREVVMSCFFSVLVRCHRKEEGGATEWKS